MDKTIIPFDLKTEEVISFLADKYDLEKKEVRAIVMAPFSYIKDILRTGEKAVDFKSLRIIGFGTFEPKKTYLRCLISKEQQSQ